MALNAIRWGSILRTHLVTLTRIPYQSSCRPCSQGKGAPTNKHNMEDFTAGQMKDTSSSAKDGFHFDPSISLEQLRQLQDKFARDRDWEQFHTPRNLLIALVAEVGELSELFQWRGEVAPGIPDWSEKDRKALGQELSDVLCYVIRLADRCQIDLPLAAVQKIESNGLKYPAEKETIPRSLSVSISLSVGRCPDPVPVLIIDMGVLDPGRVLSRKKKFFTSRYDKLDRWNKTKIYPNPLTYRGAFENKRNENFTYPQIHFEQICDDIRDMQNKQIQSPSPAHLVFRSQPLVARTWWERVIMRRLGLHGQLEYERVVIPNTPHYNRLLFAVKHLITMRPITFPDGVPKPKDIGAVRVEDHSGAMRIDEQFRPSDQRLYGDQMPRVFEGNQMRSYMRRALGIFMNNW